MCKIKQSILLMGASSVLSYGAVSSTDLALIGLYTDGTFSANTGDVFSWVALNDIAAGEVLYFSDTSYFSGTNSFTQEGLVRLTVGAGGISAGTIHTVGPGGGLPSGYEFVLNTAYSTGNPSGDYSFASSGDQFVVFQDSDVSNTAGFNGLWSVNVASNTWTPTGLTNLDANQTNLYPGLTDGTNALALGSGSGAQDEFDNARYVGPTTGSADFLRAQISNIANWERTNDGALAFEAWTRNNVTAFDIVPEPSSSLLLAFSGFFFLSRRKRV